MLDSKDICLKRSINTHKEQIQLGMQTVKQTSYTIKLIVWERTH